MSLIYAQLPHSTEAFYSSFYSPDTTIFVADPGLGKNLNDTNPFNDTFPKLSDINPSGTKAVVLFGQAGDYFAFRLNPGSHTVTIERIR